MSLVSATRSTQLLNCTSAIVLELQEKTIKYSHQSRLQTGELHELLRKPMNIHHVLQTCTMITGGGGIPPLPAHAQTVDTRPYLFSSIGLGTRLAPALSSSSASTPPPTLNPLPHITSSSLYSAATTSRYALPKTDREVDEARLSAIPQKNQDDTKYGFKLFEDWRKQRQETTGEVIGDLCKLPDDQIQHWMTRFILEVRKRDGSVYTPNTLHHITAGVMRHMRWNLIGQYRLAVV